MRVSSVRAALFAAIVLVMSSASFGQVRIGVTFGPPALPVYEQPLCPGDGYIWTPGYWDWSDDDDDYFWVPGTWVLAPEVGFLWTPPYWAWAEGGFVFYQGYWGPHIGFYGGINYGFGCFGTAIRRWTVAGRPLFYNRWVTNVNVTNIHNVYNTTVVNNNTTVNRVSYNGGNGGVNARATAEEEAAAHERHVPPAAAQAQQAQAARGNRELHASENHGKPPVAATSKPGEFKGQGAVAAREAGAPWNPPANRGGHAPAGNAGQPSESGGKPSSPIHAKDLPAMEQQPAPNTGNAKLRQEIPAAAGKTPEPAGQRAAETGPAAGKRRPADEQAGQRRQAATD